MLYRKQLTKNQVIEKMKHFCAYQERCHTEVKLKLATYHLKYSESNEIVAWLIENNYLNEERFALQFAGGRFRMKKWGRRKIQYELQQKHISPYLVKKALAHISNDDYLDTLRKLVEKKTEQLAGEPPLAKWAKTTSYLIQKGYEPDLIKSVLQQTTVS